MRQDGVAETNGEPLEAAASLVRISSMAEQPGGRVLLWGGKPAGASDLKAEAVASFDVLLTHEPWLGPVCEAAVLLSHEGSNRKAIILTPFGDENANEFADRDKHAAYVAHVRSQISATHPWIWPLLDSARAGVVVTPWSFSVSVGAPHAGAQWDVPGLVSFVALVPFAIEGEMPQ